MNAFDEEFTVQDPACVGSAVTLAESGRVELLELSLASSWRARSRVVRSSLRVILGEPGLVQDSEDRPATVATELSIARWLESRRGHWQATVRATRLGLRSHGARQGCADFDC